MCLWADSCVYAQILGEPEASVGAMLDLFGVHLKPSELRKDVKPLLKTACSAIFGSATGLVDMLTQHVPSSRAGAVTKVRMWRVKQDIYLSPRFGCLILLSHGCDVHAGAACAYTPNDIVGSYTLAMTLNIVSCAQVQRTFTGPQDGELAEHMAACNARGPLVAHVAKLIPKADCSGFDALARVFSGTVKPGDRVRVLGEARPLSMLSRVCQDDRSMSICIRSLRCESEAPMDRPLKTKAFACHIPLWALSQCERTSRDKNGCMLHSSTKPYPDRVYAHWQGYTPEDEEDSAVATVSAVWVYQARYRIPLTKAPAGNWVLLEGVDATITKTATVRAPANILGFYLTLESICPLATGCCWRAWTPPSPRPLPCALCEPLRSYT